MNGSATWSKRMVFVLALVAPATASAQTASAGAKHAFGRTWRSLRYVDMPIQPQGGLPMCGLFALEAVFEHQNAHRRAETSSVTGGSIGWGVSASVITPAGAGIVGAEVPIISTARAHGYTKDGGMLLRDVAQLARDYGHPTDYLSHPTLDGLFAELDRGQPVIVGICADDAGGPRTGKDCDQRGHAVVLVGYGVDASGTLFVVAKHSWNNDLRVWDAARFSESWKVNGGDAVIVHPAPRAQDERGSNVSRDADTRPSSSRRADAPSSNAGFHH